MSLKSVQNKVFKKSFRGYDVKQVRQFLKQLSDKYTKLVHQNEKLTNQNDEYHCHWNKFESLRKSLSTTMLTAQTSANNVKDRASKYSAKLHADADTYRKNKIKNANKKADEILKKAVIANNNLVTSIAKLQQKAKDIKGNISDTLNKEAKLFKSDDINHILNDAIGHKIDLNALKSSIYKPKTIIFNPDGTSHEF